MGVKLKVILHPDEVDGGYTASCPALPGCHSQGETREEALDNIREAIEGYLASRNTRIGHVAATDQLVDVEV